MTGVVGYGSYIPKYRVRVKDIAQMWQKDEEEIAAGIKVVEKSVPAIDEDAVTLAVEAGNRAIIGAGIKPLDIGSVYIGSESHPYAVNPSSTIVAQFLGLGRDIYAADFEFACKAATAGMQATIGLIGDHRISYGLIIGSDTAQGRPHDALEYTAASAACAYILGDKSDEIIAQVMHMSSVTSDTPDFWRRDGAKFPSHFGRFSGEPGYFTHVVAEGEKLLTQSRLSPSDFAYCVFHMPNGKFPRLAAKKLGFSPTQLEPSLIVDHIGNPYSASSLLGLAAVLDIAKPNELIFFVSYGSGAGSDGFIFQTTRNITDKRQRIPFCAQIADKEYLSYAQYLKHMHTV
jgi:hydroxymethylglutaryl-CoA synthase